jgi:hypothetical protein
MGNKLYIDYLFWLKWGVELMIDWGFGYGEILFDLLAHFLVILPGNSSLLPPCKKSHPNPILKNNIYNLLSISIHYTSI